MAENPCLLCGACCAHFRASFYWGEADDISPGGVPVELTEELTEFYRVMKGTNCAAPRCIALEGDIGAAVHCSIYDRRSSTCRGFAPSHMDGIPNERCDQARAAHGLLPLTPADWDEITPVDPERPGAGPALPPQRHAA